MAKCMSVHVIVSRRLCCAALAGVCLLQAMVAGAGEPVRIHFGYDRGDRRDLCLIWDAAAEPRITDNKVQLRGHLYYKKGGAACGFAPVDSHGPSSPPAPASSAPVDSHGPSSPGSPVSSPGLSASLSKPLAGQKIRIRYKDQGPSPRMRRPAHVTTDSKGAFHLAFPAPALDGGVQVTAAYYGPMDESAEPLVQATKKLMARLELDAVSQDGSKVDLDKNPAGPEGLYTLRARLIGWKGQDVKPDSPVLLKQVKQPVKPAPSTGFVAQVAEKTVMIAGFSVKGQEKTAGVAWIKAVTGALESEPVALPFGAYATLERIDTHKNAEIILQRPKGYNNNEGYDTEFFMDEHAELQLTLASLLTKTPLKDRHVSWSIAAVPAGIAATLAAKAGIQPRSDIATDDNGVVGIAVSARHSEKDRTGSGGGPPVSRAYEVAAGHVVVQADIKGQLALIEVPFIDSLWLKVRFEENYDIPKEWTWRDIKEVRMRVEGYVGTDGTSLARRQFMGLDSKDRAVTGEKAAGPLNSDPIYFGDPNGAVTPSNAKGADASLTRAGLAYRPGSSGPRQLTGYFKAREKAASFCLEQNWDSKLAAAGGFFWRQAGATLQVSGNLCGSVR